MAITQLFNKCAAHETMFTIFSKSIQIASPDDRLDYVSDARSIPGLGYITHLWNRNSIWLRLHLQYSYWSDYCESDWTSWQKYSCCDDGLGCKTETRRNTNRTYLPCSWQSIYRLARP